jgi:hypothetical protein
MNGNDGIWQEIGVVCKQQAWDTQDKCRGRIDTLRNKHTRQNMVNERVDKHRTKLLECTHWTQATEDIATGAINTV